MIRSQMYIFTCHASGASKRPVCGTSGETTAPAADCRPATRLWAIPILLCPPRTAAQVFRASPKRHAPAPPPVEGTRVRRLLWRTPESDTILRGHASPVPCPTGKEATMPLPLVNSAPWQAMLPSGSVKSACLDRGKFRLGSRRLVKPAFRVFLGYMPITSFTTTPERTDSKWGTTFRFGRTFLPQPRIYRRSRTTTAKLWGKDFFIRGFPWRCDVWGIHFLVILN